MENTRFEDLDGTKESGNDLELGKYWASLGDIFINDAFGTSHRSHASNVGIASNLESGIGFLIEEELEKLGLVINNPKNPFAVILGGAKVSDKIGVIRNLVDKCDYIIIGGGMAYTFLKTKGYNIGNSLLDSESLDFCKDMLEKYNDKIVLPLDSKVITHLLWEMMTECPVIFPQGIGVVPWMVPGGEKIAIASSELMKKFDAILWAHHGVFCSGVDFDLTFGLMDTIEKAAEIYVKVQSMGGIKQSITDDNFRDLAKDFNLTLNEDFLN